MTDADSIHVRIRTGEGRSFHDDQVHTDETDERFEAIKEEVEAFSRRLDRIIADRNAEDEER